MPAANGRAALAGPLAAPPRPAHGPDAGSRPRPALRPAGRGAAPGGPDAAGGQWEAARRGDWQEPRKVGGKESGAAAVSQSNVGRGRRAREGCRRGGRRLLASLRGDRGPRREVLDAAGSRGGCRARILVASALRAARGRGPGLALRGRLGERSAGESPPGRPAPLGRAPAGAAGVREDARRGFWRPGFARRGGEGGYGTTSPFPISGNKGRRRDKAGRDLRRSGRVLGSRARAGCLAPGCWGSRQGLGS